jgi:predicted PurR-regulated permease PerM
MMVGMPTKIEISHKTIIFTIFFILFLWFVIQIREIIFLLFISFIVMSAIRPFVDRLEKYHVPRVASILFVYLLLFIFAGYLVGGLIPLMATQIAHFFENLPRYENMIRPYVTLDFNSLVNQFAPIGQNLVLWSVGILSNVITLFTIMVFTFYLLLERAKLNHYLQTVFAKDTSDKIVRVFEAVETGLGSWLRGMVVLMLFVGLLTFIGLTFLKIEYALALAIIAGLLEIIPVIGPVISAVPAVLVALTISPFITFATVALFIIVQQIENHLIVPLVMNRAVGVSPLILISALMIGSKLAGTVGTILAIPIVVTVRAVLRQLLLVKKF